MFGDQDNPLVDAQMVNRPPRFRGNALCALSQAVPAEGQ
jgi:hypothetical protein